MNDYLIDVMYNVYVTTKETESSDLVIGLAKLRYAMAKRGADITGEQDLMIRQFIGRHGQELAAAFAQGRDEFFAAAHKGIKEDEEAEN